MLFPLDSENNLDNQGISFVCCAITSFLLFLTPSDEIGIYTGLLLILYRSAFKPCLAIFLGAPMDTPC